MGRLKAFFTINRIYQVHILLRFTAFLLIGIFLAKSNLPIEEIGKWEFFLVTLNGLSFFWAGAYGKKYLADAKENQEKIYLLATISSSFLITFLAIVYHWSEFQTNWLSFFLILLLLFQGLSLCGELILLKLGYKKNLLILGLGNFIILSLGSAILFYLQSQQIWHYALVLIAAAVFRILFTIPFLRNLFIASKAAFHFIKSSSYLAISILLGGSWEYLSAILLEAQLGKGALAIFKYGAKELPITFLLANALSNTSILWLHRTDGFLQIKRESNRLAHIVFPIAIVLMPLSIWFFPIVFSPAFETSAKIFSLFLLSTGARLLFPQSLLVFYGKNKLLLWVSAIEIIFLMLLALMLIPGYGVLGMAIAVVCALWLEKLLLLMLVWKQKQIPMQDYTAVKAVFGYSFLLILEFMAISWFL